MKQADTSMETDTNFGWWTDRPDRPTRQSQLSALKPSYQRRSSGIWWKAGLIIALMIAFGWSLKSLAGW